MRRLVGFPSLLVGVVVAIAAPAIAMPASAVAAGCEPWYGTQPSSASSATGVAVLSPCNAWLVGSDAGSDPVAEQWNGNRWTSKMMEIPTGTDSAALQSVSAVGPSDIWAVGTSFAGSAFSTMAEHWNGASWSIVPTRNPGTVRNGLSSVFARSSGDVWAAGSKANGSADVPLVEHWSGASWAVSGVQLPAGSSSGSLSGITATGPNNAWAVGTYYIANSARTLIEHWNGASWTRFPAPNPGGTGTNTANFLYGVTATSKTNVWAVGSWYDATQSKYRSLVLAWDGSKWMVQPSPSPAGKSNTLLSVSAASASSAWVVGYKITSAHSADQIRQTLILHWDGASWAVAPSPQPGGSDQYNELNEVDVLNSQDVWAVGDFFNGTAQQALALHCC